MRKRITLHIGSPKTGSTSIQYFLAENSRELLKRGFCYPLHSDVAVAKAHHPLYFSLSGKYWHPDFYFDINGRRLPDADPNREYSLEGCQKQIDQAALNADHIILSSEGFFQLDSECIKRLAQSLRGYEVSVVAYVRRQDRFLESVYRHRVCDSGSRYAFDIDTYFQAEGRELCDYANILGRWEKEFGRNNINLQVFQSDRLKNGDVVDDLLDVIGLATFKGRPVRANTAKTVGFTQLCYLTNRFDWRRQEDAADFRNLATAFFREKDKRRFTPREFAAKVMDAFQSSNVELSRKYLDGTELFDQTPLEEDHIDISELPEFDNVMYLYKSCQELSWNNGRTADIAWLSLFTFLAKKGLLAETMGTRWLTDVEHSSESSFSRIGRLHRTLLREYKSVTLKLLHRFFRLLSYLTPGRKK